ncbi:MAG: thiamine pyrophosphate-binding protein [Alphaproteobacteria bacterium]|nr:thiamine pyrophosphate-binding protein [Alphaproteobacteria bacterium]
MRETHIDWSVDVFRVLRGFDVRMIAHVPDAGLIRLLDLCRNDADMPLVPLTTEEEGIALLAGAWLGGRRGALLMQSSGVGNCINMLSLAKTCAFPLLMVVTMRGESGETNPWQVPMGHIAGDVLRLSGMRVEHAAIAGEAGPAAAAAADHVFHRGGRAAVLIGQQVIGVKTFEDGS